MYIVLIFPLIHFLIFVYIETSCDRHLSPVGLRYYSLGQLLELVTEAGVENTVSQLALHNFAQTMRARLQLKQLAVIATATSQTMPYP